MLRNFVKTFLLAPLVGVILSSCGCCHSISKEISLPKVSVISESDSIMSSIHLNDSIASILLCPKKIVCKLGVKNPIDTIRTDSIEVLSKRLYPVFEFIFFHPDNFKTNEIVYGNFSPSVSYEYSDKRGKQVYIQLDFGLRKWRITNSKDSVLYGGDIKANNLELLRFTQMLFPEDSTLQIMNANLKSLQK